MSISNDDVKAAALLHERAERQKLIDRALGRTNWSGLGTAIAGGAMVLVVTLVERGQPRLMIYLIGLLCSAVIALVVGHVSMIRQLHALTTILRKSGALADYLPEASDPSALR